MSISRDEYYKKWDKEIEERYYKELEEEHNRRTEEEHFKMLEEERRKEEYFILTGIPAMKQAELESLKGGGIDECRKNQ